MKKNLNKMSLLLLSLVLLLGFSACTDYDKGVDKLIGYQSFDVFGVSADVYFYGKPQQKGTAENALAEIEKQLKELDAQISTSKAESDISKFNVAGKDEKIFIGKHTQLLFEQCAAIYAETEGAFNPAAFNYVDLWGFAPYGAGIINPSYGGLYTQPTMQDVAIFLPALAAISNFEDIEYGTEGDRKYLMKTCDSVFIRGIGCSREFECKLRLDFGSIGKGYGADIIKKVADSFKLKKGYCNVSGNIYVFKNFNTEQSDQTDWSVTITNPRKGDAADQPYSYGDFQQNNISIVTSGDYEKTYFVGRTESFAGYRFCHIIDPRTGYPVNVNPTNNTNYNEGIISATIVNSNSALCDAYATAVIAIANGGGANIEKAIKFLEDRGISAVLVVQAKVGAEIKYKVKTINAQLNLTHEGFEWY
jgi:thiamine biosynthesis lipoprotein